MTAKRNGKSKIAARPNKGRRPTRLRIVITAGPTREYFDTIRFISNPSSGKMGYAIASAAARAGHVVTLISGPVDVTPPSGVKIVRVESSNQMLAAAKKAFVRADAAIFCAAVCDYRPKSRADKKLPKRLMSKRIELVPTPDIAATLSRSKGRRITVAFALEDHDARLHAEEKLKRKHCDAIVLNGPTNVGSDKASAEFLARGGAWENWPQSSKKAIARRIIQALGRLATAR